MWQLPLDRQELWMERHCKVHNKGSRGGKQRQGHPARACCVLRERTGGWLIKFLKGSTFGLKKTQAPVVAWARTTVTTTAVWMWVIWGRSAVRLATFKNWRNWLFSRRITLFFFFSSNAFSKWKNYHEHTGKMHIECQGFKLLTMPSVPNTPALSVQV